MHVFLVGEVLEAHGHLPRHLGDLEVGEFVGFILVPAFVEQVAARQQEVLQVA